MRSRRITLLLPLMLLWLCVYAAAVPQSSLCLGENYYRDQMVKVFEALKRKQLDKAAKHWQEIQEKANRDKNMDHSQPISSQLAPVWQLSEAMMMNTREGRGKATSVVPFDPWSAYSELKKACSSPGDREIADRFLAYDKLQLSVAIIKADIEKNLIDTVRRINTEEAYDRLVDLLFDYPDMSTLLKEREQLAYDKVKRSHVLADCQRFLDKHEGLNESHRIAITWRRDSLAFEGLGKTAASCRAYLDSYPSSSFNHAVEQLLHRYAFNELEPTVAACQEYVRLYPESEYLDSVKSLEMAYAFNDAKQCDNIGVYNKYLNDYTESPFFEQVQGLLQQSVKQRYFSPLVTLDDLQRFCRSGDELTGIDKNRIRSLYNNLLFLPTSAYMNDCDGLTGKVVIASTPDMAGEQEVLIFNDQGLMVRHYDERTGLDDRYHYGFDPANGFMLLSKTDASGRVVNYVTKWNEVGDILELAGSDGSIITYSRDYDYLKRISRQKGRTVLSTDYYDHDYNLDKTVTGNKTVSYQYNSEGDRTLSYSEHPKTATDTTTWQYGYVASGTSGRLWKWKTQQSGKQQKTSYRQFDKTIDKASYVSPVAGKIDWSIAAQVADTAALAALVAEFDASLGSRSKADGHTPASSTAVEIVPVAETAQHVQAVETAKVEEPISVSEETHPSATEQVVNSPEPQDAPTVREEKPEEIDLTDLPKGKEGLLRKLLNDMVYVEGGTFTMGATSEQEDEAWELEFPAHKVKVSSFYICKYEVTQELWEMVMGENNSHYKGHNFPVDMVSWDDCQKFIEKLNDMTGIVFRLPTEAEWEYAARGGKMNGHYLYAGSDEADEVAWYSDNALETSHTVGKKMPNELGLYDMSGNVWEWCADWQNYYTDEFQIDPVGNFSSVGRIQRGGCWNQGSNLCRVSFRGVCAPNLCSRDSGLRLAATTLKKR